MTKIDQSENILELSDELALLASAASDRDNEVVFQEKVLVPRDMIRRPSVSI